MIGASALASPAEDLRPGGVRTLAEFSVLGPNRFVPGSVSLAAAPDGTVYAAGFFTGEIARFTPGDDVVKPGDGVTAVAPDVYGDHTVGKEPAYDVAVGPDGSLYVAGGLTVRRIAPDGAMTTLSEDSAGGIAVDAEGSVYASDTRTVFKIDNTGTTTVLAGDTARQPAAEGVPAVDALLSSVRDVAVSPTGVVYFSDARVDPATRDRVWRINSDGAGTISTVGPSVADLTGVAVGSHGELYVATSTSVSVVSRDGAEQDPVASRTDPAPARSPWAGEEPGTTHVLDDTYTVWPGPIAAGRSGSLYYSSRLENREVIQRFDIASGRNDLAVEGSAASLATGPDDSLYVAIEPTVVAVGLDGHLYVVSDETGNREAGIAGSTTTEPSPSSSTPPSTRTSSRPPGSRWPATARSTSPTRRATASTASPRMANPPGPTRSHAPPTSRSPTTAPDTWRATTESPNSVRMAPSARCSTDPLPNSPPTHTATCSSSSTLT